MFLIIRGKPTINPNKTPGKLLFTYGAVLWFRGSHNLAVSFFVISICHTSAKV